MKFGIEMKELEQLRGIDMAKNVPFAAKVIHVLFGKPGRTSNDVAEILGIETWVVDTMLARFPLVEGRTGRVRLNGVQCIVRELRILELRKGGHRNPEIAKALGVSATLVAQVVSRLIKEGKIERQQTGPQTPLSREQKEKIVALHGEGRTNPEIAVALGVDVRFVNSFHQCLIRECGVVRRNVRLSHEEQLEYQEKIIPLRKRGHNANEIADILGVKVNVIARLIGELRRTGKIDPHKRVRRRKPYDIQTPRAQTIIKMIKERASGKEMVQVLKLSRARINQIVHKIRRDYGQQIFEPDQKIWTPSQAAKELNVHAGDISRICASGAIPCTKRGVGKLARWFIDEAGMAALRQHPLIIRERKCEICGQPFMLKRRGSKSRLICQADRCQQEAQREVHRRKNIEYRAATQQPTVDALEGWHKELLPILQEFQRPSNEEWLTVTEASRRTGLSKIQVWWLGMRKLITTRAHPRKRAKKGLPVVTYAASEVEIAGRCWKKNKEKSVHDESSH